MSLLPPTLQPPPNGLSLQPHADPSGNNQPSVMLVYRDPETGVVYESAFFFQIHGGQKIRGYVSPMNSASKAVFEDDPANSKLVIAGI